jgi:hypothetical protein
MSWLKKLLPWADRPTEPSLAENSVEGKYPNEMEPRYPGEGNPHEEDNVDPAERRADAAPDAGLEFAPLESSDLFDR